MQDDTKITRSRGRPRSFDHATTLKRVSSTFRERGYSATSLDDVSRATGLNRPSLYAAFGDKKAMYLGALAALRSDLAAGFARLYDAGLSLDESLERLMHNSIERYLEGEHGAHGCLAVTTASAEAVTDTDIRTALDGILQLIDESIAALFKRAGVPQPLAQARLVAGILHSLSVRARAGQPRALLQQMARDMLKQILPPAPGRRGK